MWGIPMLWWERIGKQLQYTGGVAVALDLIALSGCVSSQTEYTNYGGEFDLLW